MQRNEVIDFRKYHGEGGETAGMESDVVPDELPAGTVLLYGQYKITSFLNSGGFGITYRARDSLGRDVVIKECFPGVMCYRAGKDVKIRSRNHADEFESMVRNFLQEARALAALDHKNIVRVHQVFEENNTAYMAIDYVDGLDLLAVIEDQPDRLSPRDVELLTKRTLRAIKYIHDRGMLHRDISPDNILLDADDEPILIDFGAAREKAKKTGRVMSRMKFVKDGYSPQEFYVDGSEQGPFSDLYSLAASLYHLIDGSPPEDGHKRLSALAQRMPDPYIPLAGRVKGYTRGFLKTIDTCLQVAPADRFQSADEWLKAATPPSQRRTSRLTTRDRSSSAKREKEASAVSAQAPDRSKTSSKTLSPTQASRATTRPSPKTPPAKVVLSNRVSALTSDEKIVRNSMKIEIEPKTKLSAAHIGSLVAAVSVSVGVMLGLYFFGTASELQLTSSARATAGALQFLPDPDTGISAFSPRDPRGAQLAWETPSLPEEPKVSVPSNAASTALPSLRGARNSEVDAVFAETPQLGSSITLPASDTNIHTENSVDALAEPTEPVSPPAVDPTAFASNTAPKVFLPSAPGTNSSDLRTEAAPSDVARSAAPATAQAAPRLPTATPIETPRIDTRTPSATLY